MAKLIAHYLHPHCIGCGTIMWSESVYDDGSIRDHDFGVSVLCFGIYRFFNMHYSKSIDIEDIYYDENQNIRYRNGSERISRLRLDANGRMIGVDNRGRKVK